jgi:stage II sporulation protein P
MNRYAKLGLIFGLLAIVAFGPLLAYGEEHSGENYYVVYEKKTGREIFATSWQVGIGDRYISTENKLYEVIKVDRDKFRAYARYVKDVQLPEVDEIFVEETFRTAQGNKRIALYFSHSDESYVPTDGTHSRPGSGGIFNVGEAFKEGLKKNGIEVLIDKTSHDPHDANAYVRSRRTATKLLKRKLDAIFDIHRDAIPKRYYIDEVNGKPVAKIRIVLGRRNQNLKANEQLALKIKAVADKMYPGFARDIYYARGNYNQDLAPRALLFEFGTHEHTRERAENSARIFADVVAKALYGGKTATGERVRAEQAQSKGAGSGILWVLALAGLGGLGYLFLSTGGKEFRSKVSDFTKKEFGSFLARRNRDKR